jgi:hypothetical protein
VKDITCTLAPEHERVPDRVSRERREPIRASERPRSYLDVFPSPKLTQESLQVAGGAGPSLDER